MKLKKIIKIVVPLISISAISSALVLTLTSCSKNKEIESQPDDDIVQGDGDSNGGDNNEGDGDSNGGDNNEGGGDIKPSFPPWNPPIDPGEDYYFTSERNGLSEVKRRQENGDSSTNQSDSKYNGVNMALKYNYQILDTYDRTDLANSIKEYRTNFSEDENFPGYPSVNNKWEDMNSEFAKKLGFSSGQNKYSYDKTRDQIQREENLSDLLFKARVYWRRQIIKNERILDGNYAKSLGYSNYALQQMNPSDFSDVEYSSEAESDLRQEEYIFTNPDFISNEIKNNRLKKHPAADEMFGQMSVPSEQKAVDKSFRISSEWWGPLSLGLYAPAGEVITFKISDENVEKLLKANAKISIGREWANQVWNKNSWETSYRMPWMKTEFSLQTLIDEHSTKYKDGKETGYIVEVGSVFGGGLALVLDNYQLLNTKESDYIFEVQGAVEHLNWINGFTNEKEWKRIAESSNTPLITLTTDTATIFKPAYSGGEDNNYFNDLAKTNTPKEFVNKFAIAGKMSEFLSFRDKGYERRKNNAIYVTDFVPAGAAVNMGGDHIFTPPSWINNFLTEDPRDFSAYTNWGLLHELNHSFEWNQFGPQSPGEVVNNVNSMLELLVLDQSMVYRNESQVYGFTGVNEWNAGWQDKVSPYATALRANYYEQSGEQVWQTTNDIWNAWAQWLHMVGVETAAGFIRTMSRGQDNRIDLISPENPAHEIIGNDVGLATAYLLCAFPQLDLTNWLEKSHFYDLFTNNKQNVAKWNQLKTIIKEQFPEYNHFATLYSSGNFLPTNKKRESWYYTGDIIKPYQVSMFDPTVFDFGEYTTFTTPDTTLKSVKIINNPKFGNARVSDDNKSVIYTPNKSVKENYMDELDIEITDSYNNIYRTKVRPLLSPIINNVSLTTYDIQQNAQVRFDDGSTHVFDDSSTYNKNDLKDVNFTELPKLNSLEEIDINGSPEQKSKKEFFENFDKYISQISDTSSQKKITATCDNGLSLGNITVNDLKIQRLTTTFEATENGFYRVNMETDREGQYIVTIKDLQTNETNLLTYVNWWSGSLYDSKNSEPSYEDLQVSIDLNKNNKYQIDVYMMRTGGGGGQRDVKLNNLKLNYVGEENNLEEFSPNDSWDILTNNVTLLSNYEQYGESIFHILRNFTPKFYSQMLEESDLFNTYMLTNRLDRDSPVRFGGTKVFDIENSKVHQQIENNFSINEFLNLDINQQGRWGWWSQNNTTVRIDLPLNEPIQTSGFKMASFNGAPSKTHVDRAKYVKIYVDDVLYTRSGENKFRIENWWTQGYVDFGDKITFNKKIGIEFINEKDLSNDVPEEIRKEVEKWPPTHIWFDGIKFYDIDYDYKMDTNNKTLLSTSKNVTIDKNWQESYINAKYNDGKLVTNRSGSTIEWKITNARQFTIYADIGPNYGGFDVYIDNQKVETISLVSWINKYAISVYNKKFDEPGDHVIRLVATSNKWISIQALSYLEIYEIPFWANSNFQYYPKKY